MTEHASPIPDPTTDDPTDDLDATQDGEQDAAEVLPFPRRGAGPADPDSDDPDSDDPEEFDGDDDGEVARPDPDVPDDVPEAPGVPVDPAPGAEGGLGPVWERDTDRRPVLPAWVTDPVTRTAARRWAWSRATHTVQFHAVRLPVYAARLAGYAPRGLGRTVGAVGRWSIDADSAGLRKDSVWRSEPRELMALLRARRDTIRARLAALALAGFVLLIAAVVVVFVLPGWVELAVFAAVVGGLGWVGRRRDKPLAGPAVLTTGAAAPRLSSSVVTDALAGLGITALTKPDAARYVAPITRDGPGWRAELDLPNGVTAGQVVDSREQLAANLRRPLGCVWPETAPKIHPGRLVLWVGDQAMSDTVPPPWPLLTAGRVNIFKPIPFGTDPRGRTVTITLIYTAGLIGSVPRMGKTFSARLLLLAASLDPRVELHDYDLKGTGDFAPLEPVSHRYRAGDDLADIEYGLADVRGLQEEMRRRTKVIRELPRQLCPDSKVTDELASVRSHGLHPILLVVDECQRWFEHPEHGKAFEEVCGDLVRRGPATGIIPVFATQRPDAKSIPPVISANAVLRFCLKVMGYTANDMVLGSGMWKAGIRAATFAFEDKGIGFLAGEGSAPRIVHAANVDGPGADRVVARARALRTAAGTITGHAAGDTFGAEDTGPDFSILADLLTVLGEDKAHSDVLCNRLAEDWDRYDGWGPEQLSAALKPFGVRTRQVHTTGADGTTANRRGVHRADLLSAVDRAAGTTGTKTTAGRP